MGEINVHFANKFTEDPNFSYRQIHRERNRSEKKQEIR